METRGARLKSLRNSRGLDEFELSEFLEITPEEVINLENDVGKLNLTILNKLANLYGCTERYLLCMSDDYEPIPHAFRSKNISVEDLNAIAKINQIYKNMQFLLKKQSELES